MTGKLTAQRVREIYADSLYDDAELNPEETANLAKGLPPRGSVRTDGIMHGTAFHPGRLASHREEIVELLSELPERFRSLKLGGKGGGAFLEMCYRADGQLWGQHPDMDRLVQLAQGVEAGQYLGPRATWGLGPGGLPFFVVQAVPE